MPNTKNELSNNTGGGSKNSEITNNNQKSNKDSNSSNNSIKSSNYYKSLKNTITITSLPSASGTGLPYVWTTNTWKNYCPLCGKYGGLLINPKGVYEKEITCKYCDADYCGSSGKDKAYGSRATLIRA